MQIPVAGFDPSLRNWGLAWGMLDLDTGIFTDLALQLVETEKSSNKQLRTNCDDLSRAEVLAREVFKVASHCKVIFVEVPVGSQSAAAMKSYGVVVGILGSLRSQGFEIIEVTPEEVKRVFTGNKNATKREMIDKAVELYPEADFPKHQGKVQNKAEHLADAIAAIHAGVQTPLFKNIMRLMK